MSNNRMTDRQQWGLMFVLFGILLAVGIIVAALMTDLTVKSWVFGGLLMFISFCLVMGGSDMAKEKLQ